MIKININFTKFIKFLFIKKLLMKNEWDRFKYMALSDTRQRSMPSMKDRQTGQALAYPEAVLLTKPIDPQFRGEVSEKQFFFNLAFSIDAIYTNKCIIILLWSGRR